MSCLVHRRVLYYSIDAEQSRTWDTLTLTFSRGQGDMTKPLGGAVCIAQVPAVNMVNVWNTSQTSQRLKSPLLKFIPLRITAAPRMGHGIGGLFTHFYF